MRFNLLLKIGHQSSEIINESDELANNAGKIFNIFKVRLKLGINDEKRIAKEVNDLTNFIYFKILDINKNIKAFNSKLIVLDGKYKKRKVEEIKVAKSALKKDISRFIKNIKYDPSTFEFVEYSFGSYINTKFLLPLLNNLHVLIREIMDVDDYFDLKRIPFKYHQDLIEVIDLFFIGYRNTALLVLGKIFEDLLTKYLLKLVAKKRINYSAREIKRMRFEDKLNVLKSKNFLSEKDWFILSKLKYDRNVGGHPKSKRISNEAKIESESTIKLALTLLNKFDKLLIK